MKQLAAFAAFVLALVIGQVTPAEATFAITITVGGTSLEIEDGDPLDLALTAGIIAYQDNNFAGYDVSVISTSNQILVPAVPTLRTTTLDAGWVAGDPGDALQIDVTDTGWLIPADGTLLMRETQGGDWSNSSDTNTIPLNAGSYSLTSCASDPNTAYGCESATLGPLVANSPAIDPGDVANIPSTTISTTFMKTGDYSFSHFIDVTLAQDLRLNLTASTTILAVPEPGQLSLLGLGLVVVGAGIRRRRFALWR